jgi:hypothetical protein
MSREQHTQELLGAIRAFAPQEPLPQRLAGVLRAVKLALDLPAGVALVLSEAEAKLGWASQLARDEAERRENERRWAERNEAEAALRERALTLVGKPLAIKLWRGRETGEVRVYFRLGREDAGWLAYTGSDSTEPGLHECGALLDRITAHARLTKAEAQAALAALGCDAARLPFWLSVDTEDYD